MKIAVAIVVYSNYGDAQRLLDWGTNPICECIDWIVVDNTDDTTQGAEYITEWSKRPGVYYLRPKSGNVGYFGGAREALANTLKAGEIDFFVVANADVVFDGATLAEGLRPYVSNPIVGSIAPRLVTTDWEELPQPHYAIAPSRAHYARLARIYSNYPLAIVHRYAREAKRKVGRPRAAETTAHTLYAPHGAFMIFTRRFVEIPDPFRHPAFLFCEEVTVGSRCQTEGLAVVFEPNISYAHSNHGAMRTFPSRTIVRYLRDAHAAVVHLLN